MTKGELDNAERRALQLFDEWNAVTGFPPRGSSYYYELQEVIRQGVHCGAQAATGDYRRLNGESVPAFRAARGHRDPRGRGNK